MEELPCLKYWLLLITISVQIIGVVLILAVWVLARQEKKKRGASRLWPADEKPSFEGDDTRIDEYTMNPETANDTILLNLGDHGYIQGGKIREQEGDDGNIVLAHYFGGVRYAFPPSQRWGMAQRLPFDYSYGSETKPGKCERRAVTCPQPFMGDQEVGDDCFECNVWMPVGECPDGGMFLMRLGFGIIY